MLRRTSLTLALLLVAALGDPAAAQGGGDIKIAGQSRATPQLKRDILAVITGYGQARHSCARVSALETAPLPKDYQPKSMMLRVTAAEHFYERWTVDLCGTKRPFLVAMWPSPKGGADYKVMEIPPGTEP